MPVYWIAESVARSQRRTTKKSSFTPRNLVARHGIEPCPPAFQTSTLPSSSRTKSGGRCETQTRISRVQAVGNRLFVVQPEEVDSFLLSLPVSRLPGVGNVTEKRLEELGVRTVKDLRELNQSALENAFGRYGARLYELARGIDNNQVIPNRPTKSISAEDTFERDVALSETEPIIRRLAKTVWAASRKESRIARTVVLKLKTSDFNILTRSQTPESPPSSCEELTAIALGLRDRVQLRPEQLFRLVGVGLSNFHQPEDRDSQQFLFAACDSER